MIQGAADEPIRYVSVFNDITELWRKDERTRHLAFHDALTDLPNRALLMKRLERQLAVAQREARATALLFIDLDRFKAVNDSHGHHIGDELLQAVAIRLQAIMRSSDTVARLGGDEFVVLLDNPSGSGDIAILAARILASIGEPLEIHGTTVRIGASIGIASAMAANCGPSQMLQNADTAMYAAKRAGRNRYRFFSAAGELRHDRREDASAPIEGGNAEHGQAGDAGRREMDGKDRSPWMDSDQVEWPSRPGRPPRRLTAGR